MSLLPRHCLTALAFALGLVQPSMAADPPPVARAEVAPAAGGLTGRELYELMLAEIAGARGQIGLAVEVYRALATRTRDVRLVKRGAEIALFARDPASAGELARLWLELEPGSSEAKYTLTHALTGGEASLDDARLQLARVLALSGDKLSTNLLGLPRAFARVEDKRAVFEAVMWLSGPYLAHPEAHLARAQAAFEAGEGEEARAHADQALRMHPDWELGVLVKAEIVRRAQAQEAVDLLRAHLSRYPRSRDVRMALARILAGDRQYQASRQVFQALLDETPGDPDVRFAVAALALELRDFPAAIDDLERLLDDGYARVDQVRFYLGEAEEGRGDAERALAWFRRVGGASEHYVQAQVRVARLLAGQGRMDEARSHLHSVHADEATRLRLKQLEAQLLREVGQTGPALAVIESLLASRPDDPELLYEAAMLAERVGRHADMERWLRKLIGLQPGHAHAHNALGYSLADRGVRLDEAERLIDQALALAPKDPFILDSKGWVLFRRGQIAQALALLEQAWAARNDPEIGAHLGEVYWVAGRQQEARAIWDKSMQLDPENETLRKTRERLLP